eukprot:7495729-Alexandrium_andersonii.AAC.1
MLVRAVWATRPAVEGGPTRPRLRGTTLTTASRQAPPFRREGSNNEALGNASCPPKVAVWQHLRPMFTE